MAEESHRVWGLDVGIGSCGWAVLDMGHQCIVDMGVRLWDVPQEDKTKTSLAAKRRAARSARRNTKRTADRKRHCLKLLEQQGLVPSNTGASWLQTHAGDKPTLQLRAKALDRKLTSREWAQVLYSICCRRGYIPHGEGKDIDAEGKQVLKAIEKNTERMKAQNWRTIGEMLAHQDRSRNREGDYSLCITNAQLIDEVGKLFDAQSLFDNAATSQAFLSSYLEVLTWQKDVTDHDKKAYNNQVGYCTYFPEEKRAAKADYSFEACSAFERICNARIIDSDGTEQPIPYEERMRIMRILFSPLPLPRNKNCKVTYADIRRRLNLSASQTFKGIDPEKEKNTKLYEPRSWAKKREVFSSELMNRIASDSELANAIDEAVTYASSEQSLRVRIDEQRLALTDEEVDEICRLPYSSRIYNGYGTRSLKALELLLDAFDSPETLTLSDAEEASGLKTKRLARNATGSSLPPYSAFDHTANNPVVLRVMGQVRKVVNALYKEYGAPDEIHIELARELKQSKSEKGRIAKANNNRKGRREAIRKKLAEELNISPDDVRQTLIRRVELFQDQHEKCPYCGESIIYDKLIHDGHAYEIDHILPYSRTCNNRRSNKVLVHQKCNQDKRNRTPYEWKMQDGLDWEEYRHLVLTLKLDRFVVANLLREHLTNDEEAEFIERNLNDTRYASRAAKNYLENYLEFAESRKKRHVYAVAGGATAELRNAWGIKKNRSNSDLHHAIDAAVIAACNTETVKRIARAHEQKHRIPKSKRAQLFEDTEPWEGFAIQVTERGNEVIPTRQANHGVTGRAFEDFSYRYLGLRGDGKKGELGRKVTKTEKGTGKPLKKNIVTSSSNYIVDPDGKTAHILDGIAFVRLWWDPDAKVRGRKDKPGQYLMEPVYYADIPNIRRGTYTPRIIPPQTAKRPRLYWDEVPERAKNKRPLVLFSGDAIDYKGELYRFRSVNISSCSWVLTNPLKSDEAIEAGAPLSGIGPNDTLKIIEEDVLGRCFSQFK